MSDLRRSGWWLTVAGWSLGFVLLVMFFGGYLDRRRNPNSLTVVQAQSDNGVLELRANQNGQYLATGTINGIVVEFLLDTGATDVALSEEMAALANIAKERATMVQTAGGLSQAWQARAERIVIGPLAFNDVRVLIVEGLSGAVLLGMNALQGVTFSQSEGLLLLRPV